VSTLSFAVSDSMTMLRRVMKHTTRNPTTLIMSIVLPGVLLLLLDFGFGGALRGTATGYLDYLLPGILLMAACYSASATAVAVATDSSQGIINRFRTMAISRSAVLTGHVLGSVARTMIGTVLVVGIGVAIGYRPAAGPVGWLAVTGMMVLLLLTVAWLATAIGLATGNPTGAASAAALFQLLPFLSGAFVPTATMPGWLQAFAAHQPMTPIVSTLRALLTGAAPGREGWIAVAWCVGATLLGFFWALAAYNKKR
jgi:ABC-2 type transport system permease protein